MTTRIFLTRHATPDWARKDLHYDVLPGPPLTEHGEAQALRLGQFLREQGVNRIFSSPFERAHRTAQVIANVIGIDCSVDERLIEWRRQDTAADVGPRLDAFWADVAATAGDTDALCAVSHNGPIAMMLHRLGINRDVAAAHMRFDDGKSILPPAGVWRATTMRAGVSVAAAGEAGRDAAWHGELELVYTP